MIWPNDHAPPHVHIIGSALVARFDLLCDLNASRLKSHSGFTLKQVQAIEKYLVDNLHTLCKAWGTIHGN